MQDFYTSRIVLEAEIQHRRRLLTSLRSASPPLAHQPRPTLRATVAEALAHLALHLDDRSIGTVAEHHTPHPSPVPHHPGRPA